ncbi:hypothetical protein H7K45_25180 [Mycobacterium yunnanensis]|uniref:Uncharacterized protein n=1 Tax=Mycobacterium yunnanensis TaxID=368477 RepID=A0A9X2Z8J0_9MYCO|nr:hypothetical protein [Mycobacterium yunnanensis]
MGAPLKICSARTACAVLASGVVISLTALTGGVAPAFAKPGDDPSVPTTTIVPEPVAPQAPQEQPAKPDKPVEKAPAADVPAAVPTAEAPPVAVQPSAEPTVDAPKQTRAPEPVAPEPAPEPDPTPASTAPAPQREAPVTSTTKSPTTSTPAATSAPAPSSSSATAPSAANPSSAASTAPETTGSSAAAKTDPAAPSSAGESPESSSASTTAGRPSDSESSSSESSSESSTTSSAEGSGSEQRSSESSKSSESSSGSSSEFSSSAAAFPKVIEKVAPQTLEAPEADVQVAKTAKVVEEKPTVAAPQDIQNVARIIDLPNRDLDPLDLNRRRDDDQVRLAGGWDRNVRQWRPDWVQYDEFYRPVLSNPYRDPVRIVYVYQNAPRVAFIPPLGRIVLEVAQYAAYSFTAVVTNTINQAVNVAVGSFFGGGFFPGVGLPLPPPPPALVNYANVPVQVRYPDATYQPFRVSKIVDVGPDRQFGEQKVLLDGVTPAWGEWRQTPSGERSFEVHKTQQFPGLDDPRPGPLPGDYQLTLASDESPSGMNKRDVYLIAVAVACGALSIGAVALAVFMGRRRRPLH